MTTAARIDVERQSDVLCMMDLRIALGLSDDRLLFTTIPGAPWSKSRPRFAKNGHTYSKREDVDAEERMRGYLRRSSHGEKFTGNVGLACVFFRPNRQRIDTDNLLKHVCDAGTGILWNDDTQVTAVLGITELDEERPRTLVMVAPHISTLTRGTDAVEECAVCGTEMPIVSHKRKTCSRPCTQRYKGYPLLAEPVACAQCGERFVRTTSAQTMCSPFCRVESLRDRNRRHGRQLSKCMTCDKQLAHNRGGRCRDCWRANLHATVYLIGGDVPATGEQVALL